MADKKISALTSATTPLAGTEVLPIVQSGATVKVSVANLTTGRAIDATSVNKVSITAPATGATLTIAEGKTLTTSNSLTFAGTDATTMTFPTTSATVARTDAANSFTGDQTLATGNLVIGTSGKGITNSTGSVALNFSTAGTALTGAQSVFTGEFLNVGSAQTITISDANGGYIVITGVQGGVGSSTWTLPFAKRGGSIAIGTPSKAILTADPILSVAASGGDIVVTPLAGNTYFTYAIYYTPLGA